MSHNIIIYNVICMYPLHDDGPESLSLLHMGRRRTDNRINKCSHIETNVFDVGPRIIVPLNRAHLGDYRASGEKAP